MWARSFSRLADLDDGSLFPELEGGLQLLAKNIASLAGAAQTLSKTGEPRPARILGSHADDEAGKFLLFMDAARSPRDRLRSLFKRAGSHLPRLLYAETARLSPATFGELVNHLDLQRQSHYRDGYAGVEWVFRNSLLSRREEALYVDYVEHEDGHCEWQDPDRLESTLFGGSLPLSAPSLVASLAAAGLHLAGSLEVIASVWRSFIPNDATHVSELRDTVATTLRELERRNLLTGEQRHWDQISRDWTFPLWSMDLREKAVSRKELLEQRELAEDGEW